MAEATQTKTTIAIDPVTRIEGHLKAEVVVENGKVVDAKLTGGMYRGFESILRGRHPRDAAQIVQRICGVCPTAHATAASIALEKASGTAVPSNGRATRNLILGANYLQSHILHFYHLAGQDFIQGPDTAPFMLDEVILRVCDMTMRGSMARELECLIDIDPSTPLALLGDAGRLQQILTNLMGNAVKQTLEGGSLRFQFNWVNNSGGYGFKDFYFWFWVKNAGLPFILVVCACLCARRRGYLDIVLGMTAIYIVAETILFQPNEYDNNKLFYIWFMFAMILAADYGSMIMQRLAGLPGRALLCGLFLWASVFSGALSLGREAVSGYQLFSANAVAAGDWIHENTDRDDVFLTGQQHINPVCSLAGRQIICGSDLYVFFHGLDYAQQSADCRRFYENPRENADVLTKYDVHYIYVSDYERAEFDVDLDALDETYELIYENDDVRIYDTGWRETP